MPAMEAALLGSGEAKLKDKTPKELRADYIICIFVLAFFFAPSFFNISSHIEKILISGYTQRASRKPAISKMSISIR